MESGVSTPTTRRPPRPWSSEEVRYLLTHYQTRTQKEIARALGRHPAGISAKVAALARAGVVTITERAYNPPWTPAELAWARDRLGRSGWTLAAVAEHLRRSENSVRVKLIRTGVRRLLCRHTDRTLRLRDLMAVMGLTDHRRARSWIERGLLKAERVPAAGRTIYAIYPADLGEFLERHPEEYDRGRMPARVGGEPNRYLQFARSAPDPASGYLSPKQVSRRLGIGVSRVRILLRTRKLRGEHLRGRELRDQEWYVWPEEVERFQRERDRVARLAGVRRVWPGLPAELQQRIARDPAGTLQAWRDNLDRTEVLLVTLNRLPAAERRRALGQAERLLWPGEGR